MSRNRNASGIVFHFLIVSGILLITAAESMRVLELANQPSRDLIDLVFLYGHLGGVIVLSSIIIMIVSRKTLHSE